MPNSGIWAIFSLERQNGSALISSGYNSGASFRGYSADIMNSQWADCVYIGV